MGARGKEKTATAPPCKTVARNTKKRVRSNEGTQGSGSNECAPLVSHKSNKEPIATTTHSSLVPVFLEIPSVHEGFTPQTGSLRHVFDPSSSKNPMKGNPLI
ncbi:hypothetical protein J1N35_044040 [Gossypium stocksii]|uniref:Uncharacterized protein n=1 Tax=Gossypium stocksii TaxID=47602 RepID=A0A9D3ZFM1_9ROSI|nr:hypothetical protein J1N35_044040 [Gossypium stocksii]